MFFKEEIHTIRCLGKNAYSKETAEKVARKVRLSKGIKIKIYKCPVGNHWHITKKTKWRKKVKLNTSQKNASVVE